MFPESVFERRFFQRRYAGRFIAAIFGSFIIVAGAGSEQRAVAAILQ
jgi:hypothetical protein